MRALHCTGRPPIRGREGRVFADCRHRMKTKSQATQLTDAAKKFVWHVNERAKKTYGTIIASMPLVNPLYIN